MTKKVRYSLIAAGAILAVVVIVALVSRTKNSPAFFLNELKKYDSSKELLAEQWPRLVSRARTSSQHLMLLKRLRAYNLSEPYEKVLMRALWKYDDTQSMLALGADYFLQQQNAERRKAEGFDVPYVASESVQKELQKFLSARITMLWNSYPNIARLYYIAMAEERGFARDAAVFEKDELLTLYKKLYRGEAAAEDYNTLWRITENDAFLYLLIVNAAMSADETLAHNLYRASVKNRPVAANTNRAEIQTLLALLLRDADALQRVAQETKRENDVLNLVAVHILQGDGSDARMVMQGYGLYMENPSALWDEVNFWTTLRAADKPTPAEARTLFTGLMRRHPNTYGIAYQYLAYVYENDRDAFMGLYRAARGDKSGLEGAAAASAYAAFPPDFFADAKAVLLQKSAENAQTFRPAIAAVWNAYNVNQNDPFWQQFLPQYFLFIKDYGSFKDYQKQNGKKVSAKVSAQKPVQKSGQKSGRGTTANSGGQQKDQAAIDMTAYDFLYAATRNFSEARRMLPSSPENASDMLPWWHYYNLAAAYNRTKQYENARGALDRAISAYQTRHAYGSNYLPYVLMQYAYAYEKEGRRDEALEVLQTIRDMAPTFAYLSAFEGYF